MSYKTTQAFLWTCERFFKQNPITYAWRLSFKEAHAYWRYAPKWKYIMNELCGKKIGHGMYPGLQGIRVIEVHPGEDHGEEWGSESHGLHYHLIVNQYMDKELVERMGERVGLGYTWVTRIQRPKSQPLAYPIYLCKYMAKASEKLHKGMRRWDTFGGFKSNRVNDVQIDSGFHRVLNSILKGRQATYSLVWLVQNFYEKWGEVENWPIAAYNSVCVNEDRTAEKFLFERKRKLSRQYVFCGPNIVFWSIRDAQYWAKFTRVKIIRSWMCDMCSGMHIQYEDDKRESLSQ